MLFPCARASCGHSVFAPGDDPALLRCLRAGCLRRCARWQWARTCAPTRSAWRSGWASQRSRAATWPSTRSCCRRYGAGHTPTSRLFCAAHATSCRCSSVGFFGGLLSAVTEQQDADACGVGARSTSRWSSSAASASARCAPSCGTCTRRALLPQALYAIEPYAVTWPAWTPLAAASQRPARLRCRIGFVSRVRGLLQAPRPRQRVAGGLRPTPPGCKRAACAPTLLCADAAVLCGVGRRQQHDAGAHPDRAHGLLRAVHCAAHPQAAAAQVQARLHAVHPDTLGPQCAVHSPAHPQAAAARTQARLHAVHPDTLGPQCAVHSPAHPQAAAARTQAQPPAAHPAKLSTSCQRLIVMCSSGLLLLTSLGPTQAILITYFVRVELETWQHPCQAMK